MWLKIDLWLSCDRFRGDLGAQAERQRQAEDLSCPVGQRKVLAKAESRLDVSSKPGSLASGLPDGLFSNQKSKFGSILEGLEIWVNFGGS
jgi:hypothetical protein